MKLIFSKQFKFIMMMAAIVFSLSAVSSPFAQSLFEKDNLTIFSSNGKAHKFEVELAISPEQRAQGLMFRREMLPNAGMLFVYEDEREVMMWMKNTFLPLDMLFFNRAGKIVSIEENTTPQSTKTISSGQRVIGVLELNAGTVFQLGIKVGDILNHRSLQQ